MDKQVRLAVVGLGVGVAAQRRCKQACGSGGVADNGAGKACGLLPSETRCTVVRKAGFI